MNVEQDYGEKKDEETNIHQNELGNQIILVNISSL